MSEPGPMLRRLPLRRVISGAFTLPWEHRGSVFRATAAPLLALIACTLAWDLSSFYISGIGRVVLLLIFYLPTLIAMSWLAVTVHRLVLLEAPDAAMHFDLGFIRRVSTFAAVLFGIWVLFSGLTLLITSGVLNIFNPSRYVETSVEPGPVPQPMDLPVPFEWITSIARILAYWFVARVSLMLPAIAIDRKADLGAAWQASRRNGWRLAIVVGALPWCLQALVNLLYRDGASTIEFALLVVLGTMLIIFEVTALSLSYWELTPPAPPPTDPPA
ncbi:MAG TPA: hypothetical protein VEW08_13470 [Steroidobacteraceae bacterium]|nr:hypothetical protein [Steroidobacteraceae bacterium]